MPTAVTNEYLRKEFNNFELNEDLGNLIEELKYSTLIVPIDIENEGCVMVSMNDEDYIPLFTDIHEYQKVNFNKFHLLIVFLLQKVVLMLIMLVIK